MSQPLRVLFADSIHGPCWPKRPDRFEACAAQAASEGCTVVLATTGHAKTRRATRDQANGFARLEIGPPPSTLVCGFGRSGATRPLREAYALAQAVDLATFDIVVAPLAGGVSHGLLMQRATGEVDAGTRVALWCDAPTRWRVLHEDNSPADVEPLVADALERMTLRAADAVLAPSTEALARLNAFEALPPSVEARLPPMASHGRRPGPSRPVDEIVFVGPLTRAGGALTFMDAVERLADQEKLGRRRVAFVGPSGEDGPHWSQSLLGVRAGAWPFPFRVATTTDAREILDDLSRGGRLAVFAGEDEDDDRLLRAAVASGCPVVASRGYDLTRQGGAGTFAGGAVELAELLAGDGVRHVPDGPRPPTDWAALLRQLIGMPRRSAPRQALPALKHLTVCTVSKDRLDRLNDAVGSVEPTRPAAEIVVLDNASRVPIREADLAGRSAHPVRIIRSDRHESPSAAYNRLVQAATGDAVIILDDDNVLTQGGLARFVTALERGWFDIVVTTLELVDGRAATDPSAGRFVFIGEAASAGLIFNGFGDRGMALRRATFLDLGGFMDPGYHSPVSDWSFLARAQAAGYRIGVLQDPALRYARQLGGSERNWLKQDVEGGRRAVHDAYDGRFDGPLLARYAQGLQLRAI